MAVNLTEIEKLLENPKQYDYVKLLRILCQLERQYGTIEALVKTGNSENITDFWKAIKVSDIWKLTKIADTINSILILRLEEILLSNNDIKSRNDLLKIIDINNAVNDRLKIIIHKQWPNDPVLPTD